ncbi:MAG: hypothetical protein ACYDGY_11245, partial [Acidimicrobiales bacterium]
MKGKIHTPEQVLIKLAEGDQMLNAGKPVAEVARHLENRPLHAHTTEIIAHDLYEAITTSRTNYKLGIKVRSPWRRKNYRPLSFTRNYGWQISNGQLHLSLGRGRPRIDLPIPVILDSSLQEPVSPEMWG